MLYRKIAQNIEKYLKSQSERILVVSGARQIGKSFIIRHLGTILFPNYIELNLIDDKNMRETFGAVNNIQDFHLALSLFAGRNLGEYEDTLVFIDEIQECPNLLTLLKFLRAENRYHYIAQRFIIRSNPQTDPLYSCRLN